MPRARVDRVCKCGAVISWTANVCSPCSNKRWFFTRFVSGGQLAQGIVARARARGELADPRSFQCSDCPAMATEYDHRDYNKPLDVSPVCRGCNRRRGRAIPRLWQPGEWLAYVYRSTHTFSGIPRVAEYHERFKHTLPAYMLAEAA